MTIIEQLAERHAADTWVPECLLGSAGSRRMDGWAMLSTWSPMTTVGYEIKVSRSDFLRDDKWPAYLPYCHLFYWVCPSGLIAKHEVPDGCGLIYSGARLITKIKAPRREPDPKCLVSLMAHVLMCRSRVAPGFRAGYTEPEKNADYWRRWLAEKRERADLGKAVGVRLRHEVKQAQQDAKDARYIAEGAERFRVALREAGLDPDAYGEWGAKREVKKLTGEDNAALREIAARARAVANDLDKVTR